MDEVCSLTHDRVSGDPAQGTSCKGVAISSTYSLSSAGIRHQSYRALQGIVSPPFAPPVAPAGCPASPHCGGGGAALGPAQ
jgi:hypothetical protein